MESTLEVISVPTGERRIVYRAKRHFEAPNWAPDGSYLLFNGNGRLYTIPPAGGEPKLLDTGVANRCNNDHGLSFDGKWLAISDQHDGPSRIYVLPSGGGTPRLVTPLSPSYWHGWSPDGRTLAYCAERGGNFDVYTIPVEGGPERRLTTAEGLDDGPEYSPDGKYIYFNSERTGLMKIWRMKADGSDQEQVTFGSGLRRLVRASIARRQDPALPLLWQGRQRPSGESGRRLADHAGDRRQTESAGTAVRRAGHDERALLVPGQPIRGVRQLPAGGPIRRNSEFRISDCGWGAPEAQSAIGNPQWPPPRHLPTGNAASCPCSLSTTFSNQPRVRTRNVKWWKSQA